MHLPPLLLNIALALGYALAAGMLVRLVKLPPIIGYLAAGVALGPSTPGFIGDEQAIGELAELGIIFLMFGVGLHFSFRDLWSVRGLAVPGALIQMAVATGLGYWLASGWGWSPSASLLLGVSISVASTVVLLRALMDRGLLATPQGRVAVGWLVFEDIATVVILVLLPAGVSIGSSGMSAAFVAGAKAALFVLVMTFAGVRLVPWLLSRAVQVESRELFILTALTVALGTAMLSAAWFGVSLALGAFVAGVVVSESPYSHQVGADLLPFRDAFAVLFFVSVGMLVDLRTILASWREVAALTLLIVVGKSAIAATTVLVYRRAATALVVAAGLSQIGEFSFIVGQTGVSLGLMEPSQYSLILAAAIVSITLNPLMFELGARLERRLKPTALWTRFEVKPATIPVDPHTLRDHVVIVGSGRVGRHTATVLGSLGIPRLIVESDPGVIEALTALNVPTLYGDAANSELLSHAALDKARALVVTIPDSAAAAIVVSAAREHAPELPVIVRASGWAAARTLRSLGADGIVRPELEGGLQIVRRTLGLLNLPPQKVQAYIDAVRREELVDDADDGIDIGPLNELVRAIPDLELEWLAVGARPDAGITVGNANLRARTGASIVAVMQHGALIGNPGSHLVLGPGDMVAVMGSSAQVAAAADLIGASVLDRPGTMPTA